MSAILTSLQIQNPPGTTGAAGAVGTTVFTADVSGVKSVSPTKLKQDDNIIHDKIQVEAILLAASLDGAIWLCLEGRWQVQAVGEIHSVVGGSGAQVDVKVATGTQAPALGTTQLSAVLDLTTTVNTVINSSIIASPTVIGPGDRVVLDFGGTLTGLVGHVTVAIKRIG